MVITLRENRAEIIEKTPYVTPISGLTGYSVAVSVVSADLGPAASLIPSASNQAKLITVTVNGPDGVNVVLAGYRTAYGP